MHALTRLPPSRPRDATGTMRSPRPALGVWTVTQGRGEDRRDHRPPPHSRGGGPPGEGYRPPLLAPPDTWFGMGGRPTYENRPTHLKARTEWRPPDPLRRAATPGGGSEKRPPPSGSGCRRDAEHPGRCGVDHATAGPTPQPEATGAGRPPVGPHHVRNQLDLGADPVHDHVGVAH